MQESQHMEFKRQRKDDLLKWISAFANVEAGAVPVGCDDQGQAVGIQRAQKLLEDIPNKVRDVLCIVIDVNLQLHGALETLEVITASQPVNSSAIAARYPQVTQRTIERWQKKLREQGEIEFQGAPKAGGYFVKEHHV